MTKGGRTGLVIVGVLMIGLVGIGLVARSARQPERGSVLEIVLDDTVRSRPPPIRSGRSSAASGCRSATTSR